MTVRLEVRVVEDEAGIRACWPVMGQLRTALTEADFLERVQRQRLAGYRLAAGFVGDRIAVVAGFVLGEKLAWGRHLYVDDLVTDAGARSLGVGAAMLEWLRAYAADAGCESLHLDSGVQREDAHRFYRREGMEQTSAHFVLRLADGPAPAAAPSAGGRTVLRTGGGPLGESTLYPHLDGEAAGSVREDDEDEDFDPSHEGGLDPDYR